MYDYGPQMDLYAEIARFRLACQLFGNRKKARKARKGKKFFVVLLMSNPCYQHLVLSKHHSLSYIIVVLI